MRKSYPTDLTDEQWALVEPLIPPAKHGGRHREADMREVVNAIRYVNRSGCQWDMIPHDLPAKSTVYEYFSAWRDDGTWQRMHDALRDAVRVAAGRDPSPSAGSVDSQSVKTTEVGGTRGYDGGKKIKGRKRHIVVDTLGLVLAVLVTGAGVDDGTGAPGVLERLRPERLGRLKKLWADQKYHNNSLYEWMAQRRVGYEIEVVSRPSDSVGFVLLHRRWVSERTFAWLGRYRRNSKDYERYTKSSEAMLQASMIDLMLNRLKPKRPEGTPSFGYRKELGKAREKLSG